MEYEVQTLRLRDVLPLQETSSTGYWKVNDNWLTAETSYDVSYLLYTNDTIQETSPGGGEQTILPKQATDEIKRPNILNSIQPNHRFSGQWNFCFVEGSSRSHHSSSHHLNGNTRFEGEGL